MYEMLSLIYNLLKFIYNYKRYRYSILQYLKVKKDVKMVKKHTVLLYIL